jgi:hypothetical protein
MTENKSFTSQEINELVNHWQICRFVDIKTMETIISIPHFDLYLRNSRFNCSPEALEKIKAALSHAYAQGIRDVGMFVPPALSMEIVSAAMSITDDLDWKIFQLSEPTYFKNALLAQGKIWNQALAYAEADLALQEVEKNICDSRGFTEEVLVELAQYKDAKSVKELPPHLRSLFADGEEK